MAKSCAYPHDVVHDLYLEGRGAKIENLEGWWRVAIYRRVHKREYRNTSVEVFDREDEEPEYDLEAEQLYNLIAQLDEFDRTLLLMYAQGYCIKCVARETGIALRYIYQRIDEAKKCLRQNLNTDKG